jgi:hypothetical protein
MSYQQTRRVVPYPMTTGLHILYFFLGWPTCGLGWIAWLIHAVLISQRTRTEVTQTWVNDGG